MPELLDAFRQVAEASAFAGGPFVSRFETEFAAYCGTQFAIGMGSGTDALWLSLLALGVGPGDEVITVPNGFMGTAEAISLCGARPVFVDIDERTYTMAARQLEAAITLRPRPSFRSHLRANGGHGPILAWPGVMDPRGGGRRSGARAEYNGRKAESLVWPAASALSGKKPRRPGDSVAVSTDSPTCSRAADARDHGRPRSIFFPPSSGMRARWHPGRLAERQTPPSRQANAARAHAGSMTNCRGASPR